jgi:hypothetical protein
MPKSPGEMLGTIPDNMKTRTGKSIEQWTLIAQQAPAKTRKDRVEWLIREHDIGHVAASYIADCAEGKSIDYSGGARLLENMLAGSKAGLRPAYDAIEKFARSLGSDVQVVPCATQVTLRRKRQFAWIRASARARIDLGLALEPGRTSRTHRGGAAEANCGSAAPPSQSTFIPPRTWRPSCPRTRRWLCWAQ